MPKTPGEKSWLQVFADGLRGGMGAYARGGALGGLEEVMGQGSAKKRTTDQQKQQLARQLRLGRATLRLANGQTIQRWSKYSSSTDSESGLPQTDYYEGYVGERNQNFKVHIAVDANGRLLRVRDIDGTVLFDRKRGDTPPPGWGLDI